MKCECGLAEAVQGGKCRRCWAAALGDRRRAYRWTVELQDELRQAYALAKPARSAILDLMQKRTGWPRHALWDEAGRLGLRGGRYTLWSAEEDAILAGKIGTVALSEIAAQLGRPFHSVAYRAKRLEMSRRVRDGYSLGELAEILGCSRPRLFDLIARGMLGRLKQTPKGPRVADRARLRFVRRHANEIDFRVADQTYLKGVLCGKR